MPHRLAPALLCTLILAAVPATAAAQGPPPDERASARAFTDIAVRFNDDVEAAIAGLATWDDDAPECRAERRLARGTERQQERFFELYAGQIVAAIARAIEPAIDRATTDWQAVPTADPALRGGRTAWRRVHRMFKAIATIPHARICSEMREYVRGDFAPTPTMRRTARALRRANRFDADDIDRRLHRAVVRLRELGIPEAEAMEFAGETADSQEEWSSAQAPAPRSPLTLLRAAS